jgi:hypothetical protein
VTLYASDDEFVSHFRTIKHGTLAALAVPMSTAATVPVPSSSSRATVAPASAGELDTLLTLPSHTGCRGIAAACRDAALMFLNESQYWGKAELVLWLLGPYSHVTSYEGAYAARRVAGAPPSMREIDVRTVERIMSEAREEVCEVLRMVAQQDGGRELAFFAVSEGFVAPCEDSNRWAGWLPTQVARRLADRVLALVAVDYMMNPVDYECGVRVCDCCGAVSFDDAFVAPACCCSDDVSAEAAAPAECTMHAAE